MKIMTLGNGFIANHLPYEKIIDRMISWSSHAKATLEYYKPDVIVNCIGFCGKPNVDECEIKKSETYEANVIIPSLVAQAAEGLGIHMIHLGSGCIYFGESPNLHYLQGDGKPMPDTSLSSFILTLPTQKIDLGWNETDFANPKSYYSKTKYACDLILGQMKNLTILRIRMPVSPRNEPRNFINKIRGYSKVIDIPNSMTFVDDLVRCVDWAARESKTGIYHVVNPGTLSAAKVLREYQKYNKDHKFDIISEEQLDQLVIAKRSNCIINGNKLNGAGFIMTPADEALKICMEKYVE